MNKGGNYRSRRRRRQKKQDVKKPAQKMMESDESSSTDAEAEMQIIKKLYQQKGNTGAKPVQNLENFQARKKLVEERGIQVICKAFLRNQCQNKFCPNVHDKSLYPCLYFFSVGTCEYGSNCQFSHSNFQNESDINEFIRDNENFLIDVFKSKRETVLGYYFIKHLTNMRTHNRQKFTQLKIKLPNQMPPYISPQHVMPRIAHLGGNNYNYAKYDVKSSRKKGQAAAPGPYAFQNPNAKPLMLSNRTPPSMNTMSRLNMFGQNSISPLQGQNLQFSNNSRNMSNLSRNISSGKKNGQFQNPLGNRNQMQPLQGNMMHPIQNQKMFLMNNQQLNHLGNQLGPLGQNQLPNQNALYNANAFNRTNLFTNFGQNSLLGSGNKLDQRSTSGKKFSQASKSAKRGKNQKAPLLQELRRTSSGKKLNSYQSLTQLTQQQLSLSGGKKQKPGEKNSNKNFLLNQLNLAGQLAQAQALGKPDAGYLAQQVQNQRFNPMAIPGMGMPHVQIGQNGSLTQNKSKSNRDKIERIFGRMRIPKKDKSGKEKKRKLRQKMMELRKIVFENRDDQFWENGQKQLDGYEEYLIMVNDG